MVKESKLRNIQKYNFFYDKYGQNDPFRTADLQKKPSNATNKYNLFSKIFDVSVQESCLSTSKIILAYLSLRNSEETL